ncbi:MAG: hypothetical protein JNL14_06560 [Devosia sp.]|uniref:pPIWI-associating nuclease domain-containing protein n=1 Tax=Devosia sp. TaxID=1871048 RepID=UPI001A5B5897|nr:hypothetical protein [Devosia sp.]MBL8597383.1 hypothetical protein [Devosia sp.]
MALLAIYGRATRSVHIGNVIGAEFRSSDLERELGGVEFTVEERAGAMRCADELEARGLVVPTYSDLTSPDQWRVITPSGREALQRGALDSLDLALMKLNPEFIVMRRGAWRAAASNSPDALRQAAHSGRELVTQVLHATSPDEDVVSRPWFVPNREKPGQISRRARYRHAMERRSRGMSDTDLSIAVKAGELLDVQHGQLSANAHQRGPVERQGVIDALTTTEIVLRILLV